MCRGSDKQLQVGKNVAVYWLIAILTLIDSAVGSTMTNIVPSLGQHLSQFITEYSLSENKYKYTVDIFDEHHQWGSLFADWLFLSGVFWHSNPTDTRHWPNAGLMLAYGLRRWPNSNPTLGQRLLFAGNEILVIPLCMAKAEWSRMCM